MAGLRGGVGNENQLRDRNTHGARLASRASPVPSIMQFCIQGKASAPAERHLSPVFSIETEAIRTKELFFEDSVKDLTIVSISRSIWAQLRNGPMDSTSR